MGHEGKPREPAGERAAGAGEGQPPAPLPVGWRVAVLLWALAFTGLVLSELWDVFWRGVRHLF